MSTGSGLRGGDQLVATLQSAAHALPQELADADAASAQLLAQDVATAAPKLTGYLASTVAAESGRVVIGARYAVFVHAKNPWAAKVADADTDKVTELHEQAVVRAVSQVKGS